MRIGGESVNDRAPKERDIAMVFQSYALYPHMTVRENMGFALKLADVERDEIERKVGRRPRFSTSTNTSIAGRPTSPAVSASGSRWAGRSCATRKPS